MNRSTHATTRTNWGRHILTLCSLWMCLASSVSLLAAEISNSQTSGPVSVTVRLSPSEPVIGDEMTLLIEVKAEKDVEVLMPEFDEVISGFRIAEWIPKRMVEPDGSQLFSQTYRFQTTMSGEQVIPAMLVEFVDRRPGKQATPEDYDAYEILTEPLRFTVKSVLPGDAEAELRPPLGELEPPSQRPLAGWSWGLFGGLLACGSALAAYLWLRRSHRVRQENAYEAAHKRLLRLLDDRNAPGTEVTIEKFFVEISAIIRRYLEDRFELRAPELTTDEFLQLAAGEGQLSREHQRLLGEFLHQADMVKFAGVGATDAEVNRSVELAVKFLEETKDESSAVGNDRPQLAPADRPTSSPQTQNAEESPRA